MVFLSLLYTLQAWHHLAAQPVFFLVQLLPRLSPPLKRVVRGHAPEGHAPHSKESC
jgi:hypothetical protein